MVNKNTMKKTVRLTESDLINIVKRVMSESKIKIVNKSDIDDTGVWDPEVLVNKGEGKYMYLMKDGQYVRINKRPSKKFLSGMHNRHMADYIEYMTPETAEEINGLLKQARELESQAKELRKQAREIGR